MFEHIWLNNAPSVNPAEIWADTADATFEPAVTLETIAAIPVCHVRADAAELDAESAKAPALTPADNAEAAELAADFAINETAALPVVTRLAAEDAVEAATPAESAELSADLAISDTAATITPTELALVLADVAIELASLAAAAFVTSVPANALEVIADKTFASEILSAFKAILSSF
jgi:hypothetical protein